MRLSTPVPSAPHPNFLRQIDILGRCAPPESVRLFKRSGYVTRDLHLLHELETLLDRVAPSDLNVVVLGESGTGKELVATALHRASRRRARPLVPINCATALGEDGLALFMGIKGGAFTGVRQDQPGALKQADGGLLFLDELGEMPPQTQALLLRALQEGRVRPRGGGSEEAVDVRVVSATCRSLVAERGGASGPVRGDLLQRLDGYSIYLTPLRQRPEDLELIIDFQLGCLALRSGTPLDLTPFGRCRLMEHPWPGNVRELLQVFQRMDVLRDGPVMDAELVERCLQRAAGGPLPAGSRIAVRTEREAGAGWCPAFLFPQLRAMRRLGFRPGSLSSRREWSRSRSQTDVYLRVLLAVALVRCELKVESAASLLYGRADAHPDALQLCARMRTFMGTIRDAIAEDNGGHSLPATWRRVYGLRGFRPVAELAEMIASSAKVN